MESFYLDDLSTAIVVIQDDGHPMTLGLPTAGDPTSLGDHVEPALRAAAQTPQSAEAFQQYLASLPPPESPPDLTVTEKLNTLGIPLADLKAALEAL